jgi:PPOX class probable F420-dependent enzyme
LEVDAVSRRNQIVMTPEETEAFLQQQRTMSVATVGTDGRPHVVAMWYGFIDGAPAFWTYGKSQKIVNLRRDPRLTCMIEDGESYSELRGVELVADAELIEEPERVLAFGVQLTERYQGIKVNEAVLPSIQKSAAKRVVVRLDVRKVVSWDHRKLGGVY